MRLARLSLITAAAIVTAAAAACGDDNDGSSTPTPALTAPAGMTPGGSTGAPTPFPTPSLDGTTLTSPAKGYTATIPPGWSVRANLIQTVDGSADVIFAPLVPGAQAQASISINCIFRRGGEPEERISFWATNTARIGVNRDIVESQRQVDGREATVLTYRFESQTNEAQRLDKQDIMLVGDNCDWILTLSTPVGEAEQYRADFDTFLDSFRETERTA